MGNNKILFSEKNRTQNVSHFRQIGHKMSHISVADTIWARDDLEKQFKSIGAKMICFAQEILSRKILKSKKLAQQSAQKLEFLMPFALKT